MTVEATTGVPEAERATLAAVAELLIPAAHDMPSAADVVNGDRIAFVLRSRPDLEQPLRAALRPDLGSDAQGRLDALVSEPDNLAALQLVIVGGYYTDKGVRDLIGYPGQMALEIRSWVVPEYIEEGLIDEVLTRGPVWRDPTTGRRVVGTSTARTLDELFTADADQPEGGPDGRN